MTKSRKTSAIISIIIVLNTHFFAANAQNPSSFYEEGRKTFSGGLVGGASFSQVDGDRYAGYFKIGVNAGAIVYAHILPNISLSMELLFSQKGARGNYNQKAKADSNVVITQQTINLNYAEIPVMIHIYDKKKSHAGIGLSYSQLISADEKIETSPQTNYDASLYPFRKQDINLIIGGNLHLFKGFYGNIRFQYSLIPIRTNSSLDFSRTNEQYNNMWTVRLVYLF